MEKKEHKKYQHTKEYWERIYTRKEHRHIRKAKQKNEEDSFQIKEKELLEHSNQFGNIEGE